MRKWLTSDVKKIYTNHTGLMCEVTVNPYATRIQSATTHIYLPKKSELVDSVNALFLYTSKQINAVKLYHKKLLAC